MTQSEKSRIVILGVAAIVTALLVWGIIASLPSGQDKGQETGEVTLRGRIKESFTLEDMLKSVEKDNRGMVNPSTAYEGMPGRTEPSGIDSENEEEIRRIRELIRQNEAEITGGGAAVTGGVQPSFPGKENTPVPEKKKKEEKKEELHTDTLESVPETKPRRSFNSVRLVRQDEKNVIRAFVHSTQTVMVGSTLKMQLAENCLTDDGQRIHKGTPVFGEVMKIDGERVLVRITSVNLGGNILPFEKEVYSEDAMEGIYVPGNAKAETIQEAEAAGVSGAGTNIAGGLDVGSQLVAGAANSVISATKSAASKNIRKIKVTIKTNYRILLRQPKE